MPLFSPQRRSQYFPRQLYSVFSFIVAHSADVDHQPPVNNASRSICVSVFMWMYVSISLRAEMPSCMETLYLAS